MRRSVYNAIKTHPWQSHEHTTSLRGSVCNEIKTHPWQSHEHTTSLRGRVCNEMKTHPWQSHEKKIKLFSTSSTVNILYPVIARKCLQCNENTPAAIS
ncbi:hypothetical protein [Lutibacter citreus]|uniref:hypothetical protein n=1 Tax=Lutibacter citreus TaxID=2138210 RepID=UPI001300A6CB|nr:hypothetical protein [Lutibacter citreus]